MWHFDGGPWPESYLASSGTTVFSNILSPFHGFSDGSWTVVPLQVQASYYSFGSHEPIAYLSGRHITVVPVACKVLVTWSISVSS